MVDSAPKPGVTRQVGCPSPLFGAACCLGLPCLENLCKRWRCKPAQPAPSLRVVCMHPSALSAPARPLQLRWVRIGGDIDLLDAPGIIPMSFKDQIAAQVRAGRRLRGWAHMGATCRRSRLLAGRSWPLETLPCSPTTHAPLCMWTPPAFPCLPHPQRLAMCNDIGEASYVDSLVAAAFLETVRRLPSAPSTLRRLRERYKLDLEGERGGLWAGWALGSWDPGGVGTGLQGGACVGRSSQQAWCRWHTGPPARACAPLPRSAACRRPPAAPASAP